MNNTGKFLVSALLLHASNLKKLRETQAAIPVPQTPVPRNTPPAQPLVNRK